MNTQEFSCSYSLKLTIHKYKFDNFVGKLIKYDLGREHNGPHTNTIIWGKDAHTLIKMMIDEQIKTTNSSVLQVSLTAERKMRVKIFKIFQD